MRHSCQACENEIHPTHMRACHCGEAIGLCPECGGTDRADQVLRQHQRKHNPTGKRTTCRWCSWQSETGYLPHDEWGKEQAFREQNRHVSMAHPKIAKQIRAYLDR